LLYAWPIAVAYVFPDGRLLSPRWRWVAAAGAACFVAFMALAMLDPTPFDGEAAAVANPLTNNAVGTWLNESKVGSVWFVLWLGILASLVVGVVAVRRRLRRATGIERLQTMWLAWSAALVPVGLFMCGLFGFVLGDSLIDWILFPFLLLTQAAVAASIGIAVFRYRLYAIERLVNRTLVYLTLTVALLATYVG